MIYSRFSYCTNEFLNFWVDAVATYLPPCFIQIYLLKFIHIIAVDRMDGRCCTGLRARSHSGNPAAAAAGERGRPHYQEECKHSTVQCICTCNYISTVSTWKSTCTFVIMLCQYKCLRSERCRISANITIAAHCVCFYDCTICCVKPFCIFIYCMLHRMAARRWRSRLIRQRRMFSLPAPTSTPSASKPSERVCIYLLYCVCVHNDVYVPHIY